MSRKEAIMELRQVDEDRAEELMAEIDGAADSPPKDDDGQAE